jgi:hypothetical protein
MSTLIQLLTVYLNCMLGVSWRASTQNVSAQAGMLDIRVSLRSSDVELTRNEARPLQGVCNFWGGMALRGNGATKTIIVGVSAWSNTIPGQLSN